MNNLYQIAMNVCENHMDELKDAIRRVIALDYTGREEGLFAMESFVYNEEDYPEKPFVELAVGYIVDARDEDVVEGILQNRIRMMEDDTKRYLCYFYKECLKIIRTGKFIVVRTDCITSLVPEKYQTEISAFAEDL